MYVLTNEEQILCNKIVGCALKVHKELGPGLLEKIYETCFCDELVNEGLFFQRQVDIPINYKGRIFEEGLRLDVFVEQQIICEIKAVELVNPVWQAQILSHLKLTKKNIGFLINFDVPIIKNGIRRYCIEN